jgi:uncharacterized membrane protein YdjX (TVP38/TMEM64 family)
MTKVRWALLVAVLLAVAAFFIFDLGQYFKLDFVKAQQAAIDTYYRDNPVTTVLGFFLIYVLVTGLSLPGAAIMTLAAGAIFGLLWGSVIAALASGAGATVAFLLARFVLRDWIQHKFGNKLKTINAGVKKDGAFYLFTLRLVPVFPFFVVNLAMALTPIRIWTYYWVSQIGMLAGTIVFVNAGTALAKIQSPRDVLSLNLLLAFALLGVFPLLAKMLVNFARSRRAHAK